MLCHSARSSERCRAYLGSSPGPIPLFASSASTRTARAFVTSDAVAFAEAPEIERTDPKNERFEMRPQLMGAVWFAEMPEQGSPRGSCRKNLKMNSFSPSPQELRMVPGFTLFA
jgi:hypothetical protein